MYPLSHQQAPKLGKMVLLVPFFPGLDGKLLHQHALFVPCVFMLVLMSTGKKKIGNMLAVARMCFPTAALVRNVL